MRSGIRVFGGLNGNSCRVLGGVLFEWRKALNGCLDISQFKQSFHILKEVWVWSGYDSRVLQTKLPPAKP